MIHAPGSPSTETWAKTEASQTATIDNVPPP